jgi:hypothetical protein
VLCTYVRRGAIAVSIEDDLGTPQGWPQRRKISRGPQAWPPAWCTLWDNLVSKWVIRVKAFELP